MNRAELLAAALSAVNARPEAYGPPEQNFTRISRHWNVYLAGKYPGADPVIDAVDVAAMMALMKIARLEETPDHEDSWADLAGYAACGAEVSAAQTIEHDEDEFAERNVHDMPHTDPDEPPIFKVGDRVVFAGQDNDGGASEILAVKGRRYALRYSDGTEGSLIWADHELELAIESVGFKVGDRVVDFDGNRGDVTQVQCQAYQVRHDKHWYSYYPKEGWLTLDLLYEGQAT